MTALDSPFLTSAPDEEIRALRDEVSSLRSMLERANSPRVRILREPLTYEARLVRDRSEPTGFRAISTRENRSYVQDFVLAEVKGDLAARTRLDRHEQEMRKIGEERERIFHPEVSYEFEERAVNWAAGTGGYFAPPLWLIEQFAHDPVPERVLAKLAPQFELPQGAQSVSIPLVDYADPAAVQLNTPALDQGMTDKAISSAVVTIAGHADVPMQMLEQSPQGAHLDWIVFTELEHHYGYKLELQLLTGTGAAVPQGSGNNQLVGILNNTQIPSSTNVITYTDGTPSAAKLITWTSGGTTDGIIPRMVASIGKTRFLPPEIVMMTTSRAAWIGCAEIAMFPLAVANQIGPGQFDLLAYPVHHNNAIPTTLGATANQDTIIFCRPSDWLILESERRTSVYTDVLSGTLSARLQMRRYAASLLRQPTSVSYCGGSGMIVQTGF